jgi:hypothetical protein
MDWEVFLRGPEHTLEELTHAFKGNPNTIIKSSEGFALRSNKFVNLTDAADVRREATPIVKALSGIARMLLQSEASIAIASLVETRSDGSRNIFVELEPAILKMSGGLVSVRVTRADGSTEERRPSDPAPTWLAKALATPEAARALSLRDTSPLSWTDLYRLFEVVVEGAGGAEVVTARGWASQAQLRRFKHSANSVKAAGDDARHGVEATDPPADPMTISEARSLIDILLSRWLGNDAV